VAAMAVNYCYGRGYRYGVLHGEGDSRFAPLQHPVLVAVAPNAVKSITYLYSWLSKLLPVLPYYLAISVSNLICHVYQSMDCISIILNDCGVSVSRVIRGKEDPESVRSFLFSTSLIEFPCPEIATERQNTLDRLLKRLKQEDVCNFIRTEIETKVCCWFRLLLSFQELNALSPEERQTQESLCDSGWLIR
jgi:hypothetical protein